MKDYIIVTVAVILLAVNFVIQKQYQRKAGTAVFTSLLYSALVGLFTMIIFFAVGGFNVSVSPFSLLMATSMSLASLSYTIIGFLILKEGNMSLYTLFLMTGGMIIPYIWGIIFLDETVTPFRIMGILLITLAVAFSNKTSDRTNKKQLFLCVGVFLLNGICSVVSKLHQIDTANFAVNATDFVFWTGVTKFVMCLVALAFLKIKTPDSVPELPIKSVFPLTFASAAISGVSYMLQLISAGNLPASVLYPLITGGSIIFTAIAGWLIYRESLTKYQLIAIFACFFGTCLFL